MLLLVSCGVLVGGLRYYLQCACQLISNLVTSPTHLPTPHHSPSLHGRRPGREMRSLTGIQMSPLSKQKIISNSRIHTQIASLLVSLLRSLIFYFFKWKLRMFFIAYRIDNSLSLEENMQRPIKVL